MKYPFEFETAFEKDVFVITLMHDDKSERLELYGIADNKDDFDTSDGKIGELLNYLMEQGIKEASANPMPNIKIFDSIEDYDAVDFIKKVMRIADNVTAKQLAIKMWGAKK